VRRRNEAADVGILASAELESFVADERPLEGMP
jgi:hypothetical protein